MLLSELVNLFLLDVCGGKVNQTEKSYRGKLARLLRYLGDRESSDVTRNDIDCFRQAMQNQKTHMVGRKEVTGGLSPFTIRTCLVTVRFLFSWAADHRYIPMNPCDGVRINTPKSIHPKAIEDDTVIRLLKAAAVTGDDWYRARNVALIYLLRDTGGRAGGIVNALYNNLDIKRGVLFVTEKGDRDRALFLSEMTIDALKLWLEYRPTLNKKNSDHLFVGQKRGAIRYQALQHLLCKLASEAGIKERHNAHAFRHAFARDAVMNGADLSVVAAMMGHTDTRITSMYYARYNIKELKIAHTKYSPVKGMPEIRPDFERMTA